MTIRYAGPSGSGTAYTFAAPASMAQATSVSGPGDQVLVKDGTYTGSAGMISASGQNGTAGSPITISAVNEGSVFINGQDARIPIHLNNADYWIIEGLNAANSNQDCVLLEAASDHNIVRRTCAWNGEATQNYHVWDIYNSSNTVIEDCAGFGRGRKIFQVYGGGSHDNTLRRCWGMWNYSEASISAGFPKEVFSICYDSYGTIAENCIGTKNEEITPLEGDRFGILSVDRMTMVQPAVDANYQYLGCIAYVLGTQTVSYSNLGLLYGGSDMDHALFKDCVVYVAPSNTELTPMNFCTWGNGQSVNPASAPFGSRRLTNLTQIATPDAFFNNTNCNFGGGPNGWTVVNKVSSTSVAGVYGAESLYVNNGSKGATIRYRTEFGVLTSTPLWPWPMNQRIIDAMTLAGRTPVDVTATIYSLFGTSPDAGIAPPNTLKRVQAFVV